MWPWEHLAVGYLLASTIIHVRYGRAPTAPAFAAICLGSLFPDLVDKPLAWTFDLLPSGVSLAHSVFVAVPTGVAVVVLARAVGRPAVGVGFALAYLAHLPSDALYPLAYGGELYPEAFFWPLVPASPPSTQGFLQNIGLYASRLLDVLASPRGAVYVGLELLLLVSALTLWLVDGSPGVATLKRLALGRRAHA